MKRARLLILAVVLALALTACMPAGARKMCGDADAFPFPVDYVQYNGVVYSCR